MRELMQVVRGQSAVNVSTGLAVFQVLAHVVETAPDDGEAVDAAKKVISRMPAESLATVVLDWWLVVTTGAKTVTGAAYRLPDGISGQLRESMDQVVRLNTRAPTARWMQARRELDRHLSELPERLHLDSYGACKRAVTGCSPSPTPG